MLASSHADVSRLVKSVLDYLNGMERLATIMNDRTARIHFEECWLTVWCAYYGRYSLPTVQITPSVPQQLVAGPATKPAWFVAKYARPTRKVIGRTVERVSQGKRLPPLLVHYDLLECGHRVQGNENNGAAEPARHRRCSQCVPAERIGSNELSHVETQRQTGEDANRARWMRNTARHG